MDTRLKSAFSVVAAVLMTVFSMSAASAQNDDSASGAASSGQEAPVTAPDNAATAPNNTSAATDNTSATNSTPASSDNAASASGAVASLNPDIAALEKRFFDHSYPNESMASRLDRLERMVFGEQKTGSDQSRLTALLLAVPAEPAASSDQTASNSSSSQPTGANGQSSAGSGDQTQTPDQSNATANGADSGDVGDYPRITQLEQEILGKTFAQEPIQNRLEQLELKAFGRADAKADLSDRTEKLEDYADKHFPQQQQNYAATADGESAAGSSPYSQASGYSQAAPNANSLPPHSTLDQKVTWLERQVFNTTYASQPLLDRVNRLATNIFPADSPQRTQSLADQVNSMIGAIELNPRHGGPAVAQAPYNQDPQYNQSPQYNPQYNQAPQYGQTSQNSAAPFSQYPQYGGEQPNYSAQTTPLSGTPTTQGPAQNHGHSFIHGLAHVLGTVGQMAAGSMMGGMGGYGGGYGMGGFGMPFGL